MPSFSAISVELSVDCDPSGINRLASWIFQLLSDFRHITISWNAIVGTLKRWRLAESHFSDSAGLRKLHPSIIPGLSPLSWPVHGRQVARFFLFRRTLEINHSKQHRKTTLSKGIIVKRSHRHHIKHHIKKYSLSEQSPRHSGRQ